MRTIKKTVTSNASTPRLSALSMSSPRQHDSIEKSPLNP